MNKKQTILTLLFAFLGIFFSTQLYAQTQTDSLRWKVQTEDGNRYVGYIMGEDEETLTLQTENLGEIQILKSTIKLKRPITSDHSIDALNWYQNDFPNRYVLLPTGIFRGGKGAGSYYENRYVLINHLHLQLSESFGVGVGMIPAFIFDGAGTPAWIAPRFRIKTKKEKLHISASLFHGRILFDPYSDGINGTFGFGMLTYGDDNISLTIGTGYGIYDDEWIDTPALALGGNVRVGRRMSLYLETLAWNIGVSNYYSDINSFTMTGGRAMWNRFSLDFGLILSFDEGSYDYNDNYVIPYLGIIIPVGR